jgi:hypothetical protein
VEPYKICHLFSVGLFRPISFNFLRASEFWSAPNCGSKILQHEISVAAKPHIAGIEPATINQFFKRTSSYSAAGRTRRSGTSGRSAILKTGVSRKFPAHSPPAKRELSIGPNVDRSL